MGRQSTSNATVANGFKTLGLALLTPGKMVQAATKAAFGAVMQADDRFESSGIGANDLGHFLGGFTTAAAAIPLGVVNIAGAVLDGNAEKTAFTMATHPGTVLQQVVEQPAMILGAFIHHPAHVAGAALVFTTGLGAVEGPGLLEAEWATAGRMAKVGDVLDKGGVGHQAARGVRWVGDWIHGDMQPAGPLGQTVKAGRVTLGTVVERTGYGTDWIMGNGRHRWAAPLFAFGRKQVADSLAPSGPRPKGADRR
jgi:hypothetical protein